jgi:uncharacterized OB-fold protein
MGEDARAVASIPRGEGLHGEFYTYCARHELRFQRCSACSAWRHMPRDRCARCGSDDWEWAVSNGKGLVLSWTVCHRAFHPSLDQALPYAVALVEFEPGARLIARLLDVDVETVCAGLGVEVCFEELAPGHVVPRVRPRSRRAP